MKKKLLEISTCRSSMADLIITRGVLKKMLRIIVYKQVAPLEISPFPSYASPQKWPLK